MAFLVGLGRSLTVALWWKNLARLIPQRLLVRSMCKLDAFKGLNELFKMHKYEPMTSGAHKVQVVGTWRHWSYGVGLAFLVGLGRSLTVVSSIIVEFKG